MPPSITRLLNAVCRPRSERRPSDLHTTRTALLSAIEDCHGLPADQLKLRIRHTRHHRDLWQLRSEAFHVIALQHCQSIADERIGELLHHFDGRISTSERQRTA